MAWSFGDIAATWDAGSGSHLELSKKDLTLSLFGTWDPSLALVMGAAIDWPTFTTIDRRLRVGGVLFGAGWGLGGFCPGPALVAFASGFGPALWFVPAMLVGMWAHDRVMEGK